MFDTLKQDTQGIKESGDFLGGGGVFSSGAYDFKIKVAYLGVSSGGANSVNFEFEEHGTGRKYKETFYVTSGTDKGCKPYYEKDGQKHYLPGYEQVNAICLMTTNEGLADMEKHIETATLKLYDFDAKAEVPKAVKVITALTGKDITLGLLKKIEDKKKKVNGEYVADGTKETNEVNKVFHFETKKTIAEARAKGEAEFYGKWKEQNTDKVIDKSGKGSGTSGRPTPAGGNSAANKPASLFD